MDLLKKTQLHWNVQNMLSKLTLHFLKGPPRLQEINFSNVVKDELEV